MEADRDLRLGVRAFVAGDMNPAHALQITDAGVKDLCRPFPNLEVIRLYSTKALAGRAFPEILLNCANIEAVTITAIRQNKTANLDDPEILQDLVDKEYRAKLRYKNNRWFAFLTTRRPSLEVVFEDRDGTRMIRDMESTPLSRVPPQSENATEGNPEDDERQGKRDNARALKRRLNAVSNAMDRSR
jgi:hypothetical protein